MKRSSLIIGLAIVGCLAAAGAKVVFGQAGGQVIMPTPPMPPSPMPSGGMPDSSPPAQLQPGQVQVPEPPGGFKPGQAGPFMNNKGAQPQVVVPPPPAPVGSGTTGGAAPMQMPLGPKQIVSPAETNVFTPPPPPVTVPGKNAMQEIKQATEPVARKDAAEPQKLFANPDNPGCHQEPAVSLDWVGPSTARLNQVAVYQITAKNISVGPVQNVIVRYRVPAGVRLAGSEPRGLTEGAVMTWDLGTLAPEQEKRIELQIVPQEKAALICQASVTFTGSSTLKVQVQEPRLTLKANAPERTIQGDVATVSLNVGNPGDGTADHVKVKATLPEGLEHARGKSFELDLGTLLPGENRTVQLVCLAKSGGVQHVECVAVADAGLTAKDVAKVDVVNPRLDLVVTGPKLRYVERHATYALKVTNPGSAPAGNVCVVHQLPAGFRFHSASNGGRHDFTARTVTWFVGDLTAGESREVTVDVVASNIGDHRHLAVATAARGLKAETEVSTRVEGLSALLLEVVDADDPVEVGVDTAYEIRVTNTGSKMETNLELVCTLPDKMEFRGAKCPAGSQFRVEGKDIIFEPLPRLAPRADVVYRVMVRGVAPADLRFRARIKADGLSEPVLREEITKVYGDDAIPR